MSRPLPSSATRHRFGVVVPVKPAATAKSRLSPLGDGARRDLVPALALDTIAAALECPAVGAVLVVTDDAQLALQLRTVGVDAVPDGESGSLNATLKQGAAELLRRRSGLVPVALCADLPALRADDLDLALGVPERSVPAFVPDAAGVGTTMYVAPTLDAFDPRFGPASRAVHLSCGAEEITLPGIASLRTDVDTPDDLRAAVELGLGPRSSWVVTSRRLLDP